MPNLIILTNKMKRKPTSQAKRPNIYTWYGEQLREAKSRELDSEKEWERWRKLAWAIKRGGLGGGSLLEQLRTVERISEKEWETERGAKQRERSRGNDKIFRDLSCFICFDLWLFCG